MIIEYSSVLAGVRSCQALQGYRHAWHLALVHILRQRLDGLCLRSLT